MAHLIPTRKCNDLQRGTMLSIAVCAMSLFLVTISAGAVQLQAVKSHVPNAVAQSRVVGLVPESTALTLAIGLPLRNPTQLDTLLEQISDPSSANYHHYLTPQQFASQFGPSQADYQALIAFAQSNHLTVTGIHANRVVLDVSGNVGDIEKTLHLNIVSYVHPTRGAFFAPDREPTIDSDVSVLDISGLDNFELPHPMNLNTRPMTSISPNVTGSGPGGYFIGKDFRAAYAPSVNLTGTGQTVGLLEFDGFYAADVASNFARAGQTAVPTQTVLLDGYSGAAGSSNIEVTLDIMMAAYMAPGLTKIIVYEGSQPNDILNRMATDNLAQQLSSSWTFSPINATTEQIFKQYIAQGQSLLQASGDSGAYTGGIAQPADDPNLTVVGGTSLTTGGASGPWQSEATWSGSGGGISTTYAIPSYQQGTSMTASHGSTTMRNIPDVALTADIQMYLIQNNGQAVVVGGTSAAAPLWAGFIALANQQAATYAKARVGFLNPLLYSIGNGVNYSQDLHDIRTGTNTGFSAVAGYDLATGWGSPAGQHLIYDLTGTSGGPSFTLAASAAALSLKPGTSGTSTITIAPLNGFTTAVNLAITGLPAGVTAAFAPASTTKTSTLTVTASSAAVAGTYSLTVAGTSSIATGATVTGSTTLALTVVVPGFSLASSASTVTLPRSSAASSTITVSPVNGFTASVALTAAGLPTGVTAVFSPATTTTTSSLAFTATATAVAGTYPVVVTGTSGTLKNTATISLVVTAPAFTLSALPVAFNLPRGSTATSAVSVTPVNGFVASVNFTATGLPAGVAAVFSPASTTTNKTNVTFAASATAVAGNYSVVLSGTSGTLVSTATITVTVTAPTFTLSMLPATLTLSRGATANSVVTVVPLNGFSAGVNLTATGLPSGVTAAYSPAATTSKSTVTFSASATAVPGTYNVVVTGTSGTLVSTAVVSVTVTSPNFSLSILPGSLGLPQGFTAAATLTIVPVNGFNSSMTVTPSGLPTGVTATFGALTAINTSTVTFAATSTAVAGNYPITLTGVSGALKNTASLTLTVIAAQATTIGLVNLSPSYNVNAFVVDGLPFTGAGLDGGLNGSSTALSANLVGVQQTVAGTLFYFGPANALDAVSSKVVALPAKQYSTLKLLATGVNGNQAAQVFKVTYTDGTSATFTQSLSDWFSPLHYAGETAGLTMAYRDNGAGVKDNRTFYFYEYSLTLNPAKTLSSITLPTNRNVVVLAATLTGPTAAAKK